MTSSAPLDRAEFTALLKRHDDKLRALAYRMLGGDRHWMDDALQDAYLSAYRSRASLRNVDEAGSWLYRIVYNACVDELRRKKRRPQLIDADGPEFVRLTDSPDEAIVDNDVLRRALATLPEDQRATVILVDAEGFDNVAAAEFLGVAPGTVASRLSRARQTLRSAIGDNR